MLCAKIKTDIREVKYHYVSGLTTQERIIIRIVPAISDTLPPDPNLSTFDY